MEERPPRCALLRLRADTGDATGEGPGVGWATLAELDAGAAFATARGAGAATGVPCPPTGTASEEGAAGAAELVDRPGKLFEPPAPIF